MGLARKLAESLRRYMLLLTIVTALVAVMIGSSAPTVTKIPPGTFKGTVMVLAAATIFPSMILLRGERLGPALKQFKHILIVVLYAYALSPLLAYLLSALISSPDIKMGFLVANTVPASSASIGYVMLAEGNLELATACVFTLTALGIALIPTYLYAYASMMALSVPVAEFLKPVLAVLAAPLFVGQLVRRYLIRRRGSSFIDRELKPYLSAATILMMLTLIFVLISRKAVLIVRRPYTTLEIMGTYSVIVLATVLIGLIVSRSLKITYREHQAIMFLTITKNQSVAAAVAACGFSPAAALAPALIPTIQPVLAIAYLHTEKIIKSLLAPRNTLQKIA